MVEHVSDVLDHGVDDLAISFFSHLLGQGVDQADYYGFNPPALAAYRERHGLDPLRSGVDPARWRSLHGDFYTELVERLHEQTRPAPDSQCNTRRPVGMGRQWRSATGEPLFPGQRWAERGIADALLMVDSATDARAARRSSGLPVIL